MKNNMETERKVVMQDVAGRFGFRIRWEHTDEAASFVMWNIVARQPDGLRLALFAAEKEGEFTPDPIMAQPYLSGAIMADGRWMFNESSIGCGPTLLKRHLAAIKFLFLEAHNLMGKAPQMPWDEA